MHFTLLHTCQKLRNQLSLLIRWIYFQTMEVLYIPKNGNRVCHIDDHVSIQILSLPVNCLWLCMVSRYILEFRVLLLDWRPIIARVPIRNCYLIHRLRRRKENGFILVPKLLVLKWIKKNKQEIEFSTLFLLWAEITIILDTHSNK